MTRACCGSISPAIAARDHWSTSRGIGGSGYSTSANWPSSSKTAPPMASRATSTNWSAARRSKRELEPRPLGNRQLERRQLALVRLMLVLPAGTLAQGALHDRAHHTSGQRLPEIQSLFYQSARTARLY